MPKSEYEEFQVSTSSGKQEPSVTNAKNEVSFVGADGLEFADDLTVPVGIYVGVPFDEYRRINALNNSRFSDFVQSPRHYEHYRKHPKNLETPALTFGSLAHCGVLEPARLLELYVILPDFAEGIGGARPTATKEYKAKKAAFESKHTGKTAITDNQFQKLLGVVEAVDEDKRAREAFQGGRAEVTMVWVDEITGKLCKARPDYMQPGEGVLCDLKTTRDARDFGRSIAKYGYDRQAAWYLRGARALNYDMGRFFFVVVESDAPHGVLAAPLDADTLEDGRLQIEHDLRRLAECEATGKWPGYVHPDSFKKPSYAMRWVKSKQTAQFGGYTVRV
jgi:hypothetical protein